MCKLQYSKSVPTQNGNEAEGGEARFRGVHKAETLVPIDSPQAAGLRVARLDRGVDE